MSLPEDLLPGSFRGISFLMTGATTTGSKKLVKKQFPNSPRQSLENLGRIPQTLNVSAILTGDNYLQRRNALIIALDNEDFGTLIHPFYGTVENVIAANYSIEERMSSLADTVLSIVFEINTTAGLPEESGTTLSVINTSNLDVVSASGDSYIESFQVSEEFPNNFTEAASKMGDLVDAFSENTTFLSVAADEIDSFSLQLSEFANSITQLVTDPVAFVDSVNGLYQTMNNLYATPGATYAVLRQFFNFGDDDNFIQPNTTSRTERIQNNSVLNQYVQAQALSYSYLNVTEIQFDNVDQVQEIAEQLEIQYQKIFNNLTVNGQNPNIGISPDAKSSITDMRVLLQEYFNDQRLNTQQIIGVYTNSLPARFIAYQYYGSSNLGEEIAELNNDLSNPSFVEGDIRILSS